MENNPLLEAQLFGKYILNKPPTPFVISLYQEAMVKTPIKLTDREKKLLDFMLRHPWSIKFLDAALAYKDRNSNIRHKMFIMLAICECQPDYVDQFLTKDEPWFYLFYILWVGIRGILKAIVGILMLAVL
ncbi:MAG: hypothetical protein WCL14_00725 [Bacteroidota bacterium]